MAAREWFGCEPAVLTTVERCLYRLLGRHCTECLQQVLGSVLDEHVSRGKTDGQMDGWKDGRVND